MMRAIALLPLLLLAACARPQPPDTERPPEPQATQLRDAVRAPLERAEQVQRQVDADAKAEQAAIDAAGG
jgi:hypothetical protein